jgi:hypothetical protein
LLRPDHRTATNEGEGNEKAAAQASGMCTLPVCASAALTVEIVRNEARFGECHVVIRNETRGTVVRARRWGNEKGSGSTIRRPRSERSRAAMIAAQARWSTPLRSLLLAVGLLLFLSADIATATNRPNKPAIATLPVGTTDMFVSITGQGFGDSRDSASKLEFTITPTTGALTVLTVPSTDMAAIPLWSDAWIVAKLSSTNVRRVLVSVVKQGVAPTRLKVVRYGYEWFDTHAVAGSPPNGLTMDRNTQHGFNAHRAFLNLEFHTNLVSWNPDQGATAQPFPGSVQPLPGYPAPPVNIFRGIFQNATRQSSEGDHAVVDSLGRIWFNESGVNPGTDAARSIANHSRLLAFDGTLNQFRLYNIPGDQEVLYSMAWDAQRRRVWFVLEGTERPHRLVVFDPEGIPHGDLTYSWTSTNTCNQGFCQPVGTSHACQTDADCILADQWCPPGTSLDAATNCYLEIPLPASLVPGSQIFTIAVNPRDGSVWMSDFSVGFELLRYDPNDQAQPFVHIPIPRPHGLSQLASIGFYPPFPLNIEFTSAGDIVTTLSGGNSIGFIRGNTVLNKAELASTCSQLTSPVQGASCTWHRTPALFIDAVPDASCVNPCITETLLAGAFQGCIPTSREDPSCPWNTTDDVRRGALYWSWLTADKTVWFDLVGEGIGYIRQSDLRRGRARVILFPPISSYDPGPYSCQFGGPPDTTNLGQVAVDESRKTVWHAEYCRQRLARHWPLD